MNEWVVINLSTNWHKIYIIYLSIISVINMLNSLIESNFVSLIGIALWLVIIIFSFKRKEYNSLTLLWILRIIFLIYNIFAMLSFGLTNVLIFGYIYLATSLIDVILLKLAINYSKANNP